MIDAGPGAHRRDNPERHRNQNSDAHRRERQLESGRQPRRNGADHRLPGPKRCAQVADDGALQEGHVLRVQRAIETQALAQLDHVFRRGALTKNGLRRIAGNQVDEGEHQRGDAEQHGEGEDETAQQEPRHRR